LEELRPVRNDWHRVGGFREQPPQVGVVPAQLVPGGIPVPADPVPQPSDLGNQLFARHPIQIAVHASSPPPNVKFTGLAGAASMNPQSLLAGPVGGGAGFGD
jgi:hypothetical protein